MYDVPWTLADLLALPDVAGFPPPERRQLYMAYLHWQLTRPGGVVGGNQGDKKRLFWKEKRAQGHLSPVAERVLVFIAQRGIVTTTQITSEMPLARGTMLHQQKALADGGYVVYRPGGSRSPGTMTITRKGLERAGLDPETPVPAELPAPGHLSASNAELPQVG